MSKDDQVAQSVRVINEEYERVLSNPDNVIMSDELHALMNLDFKSDDPLLEEEPVSVDTMTIVLFDADGLPHKVRGDLSELSSNGSSYTIKMNADKVSREVLALLESSHVPLTTEAPTLSTRIVTEGMYNLDFTSEIFSWSVKRSAPHTLELQISFRSSNVIF